MGNKEQEQDVISDVLSTSVFSLERLLTAAQVAELLHLNIRTLARWRLGGEGPAFLRLGPRQVRYSTTAVADFMERSIRHPGF